MSQDSLNDLTRVAVITGAGSGIGRATSIALARDGFSLVCAGRRQAALEATRTEIESAGGQARCVVTDVTDEESVVGLFTEVEQAFGRLDLLFNNAGAFSPAVALPELSREEWDRVVATNLTGTFLCTREAFRIMRDQQPQGGRIINNGSIAAMAPRPNSAAYTATKHAVTGITKSTALDGRPYRIACGQIDVGNATELAPRPTRDQAQPDGSVRPEPTMSMADVARAVSFMASLPLDANVPFMTVMATNMPYLGRG